MESDTLRQNLATNLKRLRKAGGWSQEELASRVGCHRTYFGAIERGERNITLSTLQSIAEALSVDPISLLLPHSDEAPQ